MPAPAVDPKNAVRRSHIEKREWIASASRYVGDECLDWPWSVDGRGYAQVWDREKVRKVSHLVLVASGFERPPAPNNQALHSCDRPRCVSPAHLRWGNQGENLREMFERQRRVIDQPRNAAGQYALTSH